MDAHRIELVVPDASPRAVEGQTRLDARARAGDLVRVRRAVYVPADQWDPSDAAAVVTVSARAAQSKANRPLVFSHLTAAQLWGLPVVGARDARLHVTNLAPTSRRTRHGIVWHSTATPSSVELTRRGELSITSARQTALDLARSVGAVTAFIVADAVARESGEPEATREWWRDRLVELGSARGVRRAASVLALVTGLAESPLESLSLLRIHELGFAAPRQQVEIATHRGVFRLDFAWEGRAIAGEADGRAKYGGRASPAAMEQRLWEEKLREDAIRERVTAFPRWTWDDAWWGHGLERALLAARVPRPAQPARITF